MQCEQCRARTAYNRCMTDTPEILRRLIARLALPTRAWEPRDTYWAKLNLVHACRELNHNAQIEGRSGRSDMWLLPSPISLHYSLAPKGSYNETATTTDTQIADLSFDALARPVRQELRQYA